MNLGRVIGTVVATQKYEGLQGKKFLLVQPLDQPPGNLALQEGVALPVARRPLAPMAQGRAVENQQGIRARHSGYVRRKSDGG